jgi:hypothetical protein
VHSLSPNISPSECAVLEYSFSSPLFPSFIASPPPASSNTIVSWVE